MEDADQPTGTAQGERGAPLAVSVIIPVLDDLKGIRLCLRSMAQQLLPADCFEVIVVDNGPAEGATARVDALSRLLEGFPHAMATNEPKRGSYAARNRGLSLAKGRVLAFTDADCLPESSWLETGLAYLRDNPQADALVGAVHLFARDAQAPTAAELYEMRHAFQQEKYAEAGFGATANLFARRSAFDAVGPFDGELRSSGDKEWGLRLTRQGLCLHYSADVIVRHPARRTLQDLRIKAQRVVSGDQLLRKRAGWRRLNWLRYSLQPLRPPLRTIWRARQDPSFSEMSRLCRYGAAFIMTRWITSAYRLRCLAHWGK